MSEIITDKLTGRATAGDVTITSEGGAATMQLQQGVAKQWCLFNGTAGTLSLDASLNTSSLTDVSVGNYNSNYASNMSSAEFFSDGDVDALRHVNCEPIASSYNRIRVFNTSNSAADQTHTRGAVLGDLA